MIKKVILIAVLLLHAPLSAQFQDLYTGVGTNAADFLNIGVGGRAMGMGGAYTAFGSDPTSLYYNPAGIVWNKDIQVEFMHNEWLVETNYDFVGLTVPLPVFNATVGLSYLALDYGEQEVRTVERPDGTGERWSAYDYAVGLTFASALTDRFSFGLTVKYINQQIWHTSGGAVAMDVGVNYLTAWDGVKLGMSISNFGSELQLSGRDLDSTIDPDEGNENVDRVPVSYKTGSYPLPITFRVGVAWDKKWKDYGSLILAVDLIHPSTSNEYINAGIEYGFMDMFYVRGGYESLFEENAENGLTIGGGVDYMYSESFGVRVDYAWGDWGLLEQASRFSIGFNF
jgi:opacity protein-like surface antigen